MLKWKLTRRVVMGICLLGAPLGATVQAQETAQTQDAAPATSPPVAVPDKVPAATAPMSPTDKAAAPAAVEGSELYLIGPDGQKRHLRSMQGRQGEDASQDEYRKAVDALPQGERYVIGVVLAPVPSEVRAALTIDSAVGLFLVKVVEGKPAAAAGLKNGDVLCAVNGKGVSQPADVVRFVNELKGQPVTLTVARKQETVEIIVTPVEASKELASHRGEETVELSPETMQKLRELGVTPGTQVVGPGVIVNSTSLLSREVIDLKLKVGRLEQEVGQLQHQVDELKQILKSALTPPGEAPVN
ncbi:PDZ domain-containing protein [Planctomicrobium piriforme]|uniref:PDZ domain-containing protein n=1 Tax=Planctomicrobium piriforme TaxID=1576369 RepID=A0A1I3SVX4_9PLAN|nr:PDZ domain-containing protein [Planctomicrobium piriforme]SFJ62984.1 PDZ domain-containing protein [Planctomicrobium piriforme]